MLGGGVLNISKKGLSLIGPNTTSVENTNTCNKSNNKHREK